MRSTLKKSLYLGLAALSFASVAGVANNANASKHHKATKTYATASYRNIPSQGNSHLAYNVTGTNAMFNKPGTVKGAKQTVSKATMSDLASAKENFMVYQTAVTSRNSKYIKVVSFDKKYRGWIYAGKNDTNSYGSGVNQINLSTQGTSQYNSVYLKNPGNVSLKSSPEGAQFDKPYDSFAQTGLVASDAFNVDAAQNVSATGTTWYHLVDQKDNTINGWVPKEQVQLSSQNNYFNPNTDVKVNYTSNGQVVKTGIVNVSNLAKRYNNSNVLSPNDQKDNSGKVTADGLASAINDNSSNVLNGTDYQSTNFDVNNSENNNDNSVSALQYVEPGDTMNISVGDNNHNGNVASKMNFNVLGNGLTAPSQLSTSSFKLPALNTSQLASQMNGYNTRERVNMQRVLGLDASTSTNVNDNDNKNVFGVSYDKTNPNKLGVLYGNTQYAQSNITDAAANDQVVQDAQKNNGDGYNVTKNTPINQGSPFHYDYVLDVQATRDNNTGNYGQNVNLYYKAVAVPGATTSTDNSGNTTTNY